LSAATKLIPTAAPGSLESGAYDSDEFVPDATVIGAPPPATAAGGANGATQQRTPPPAAAGVVPPPRGQVRPGTIPPTGRRPAGSPAGPESRGGISRPILITLIGLGIVAVIVLVFVVAGLGSSSSASHTSSASASRRTTPAVFRPESVTVAVLNGTSVSQLAHHVAAHLNQLGYRQGTVATASDQTRTTTVVAFMPDEHTDALHVANALKLKSASVQAMDAATKAVACPPGQACKANVVVTVGTDLANTY
jgi:LytR cell envelope-related transcriptional attenuator